MVSDQVPDKSIGSMTESEIKQKLLAFKARFKFDFTEDYLNTMNIDNLRHMLSAAMRVQT
jgi:hypothetical protein